MLKASFYTLGCRLNQAETALISSTFTDGGYEIVPFNESADVCVINSCTVTEHADAKCRQLVRQVLKRNPQTYVAVVGCYSQTFGACPPESPSCGIFYKTDSSRFSGTEASTRKLE